MQLQSRFAAFVEQMRATEAQQTTAGDKAEAMFNALLTRTFASRAASCGEADLVDSEKVAVA